METEYTREEREALAKFLAEMSERSAKSGFRVYKNGIYNRNMTELHRIFSPGETFEVPEGVKQIKAQAGVTLKGLRRLIIPEGVENIDHGAFYYCSDLEYADIHAKNIEWRAFASCNRLKEVRLRDGLEKIGDGAFEYTDIKKLILPPSVRDIGHYILLNADPTEQTLEIYLKDGAPPKTHGLPAENGTLLIARSPKTDEKVCEFVISGKITKVFTQSGIDFSKYDERFHKTFSQSNAFRTGFKAAQARLRCPCGMDGETRRSYEEYSAEAACYILLELITQHPDKVTVSGIADGIYLELVTDEGLLKLIDASARAGKTELTAFLMQRRYERRADKEESHT